MKQQWYSIERQLEEQGRWETSVPGGEPVGDGELAAKERMKI